MHNARTQKDARMNLFGNSTVDGNGKLVRNIALAGGIVAVCAVVAASFLDRAAQNGTLASINIWGSSDPSRHMAGVPRAGEAVGGVRYGNVDYMSTATIPANRQRVKNVVADPTLGMPN
jgi:hypothetical protein